MTVERRRIFGFVAWLLPLLFFAAVEGGLRLAGFGKSYPLFVPVAGQPDYLVPNDKIMRRYFANPAAAPDVSIDTTYFRKRKPEGSLRIFVQGGSTAAGFPYGRWASPAGMLERRLADTFPEREVEVISTAMSAVNSYTLLDFADEILAQSPDAIVIYAGHNEYLGVLGVGSAMSGGGARSIKRLTLWLRDWRIYQLVARVVAGSGRGDTLDGERSGTLMARIAGERRIPLDSPLYRAGVAQFRDNLNPLLARYREAGVPVIIATLASNERHQAPFAGGPATASQTWQSAYQAALDSLQSEPPDLASANQLLALDEAAAGAWFVYAQQLLRMERAGEAREAFIRARDLDALRFRAPSAMNQVIREAAERHGATLADVDAAMRADSPDEIIGNELMLEHLHPNVRGYFLLADACYDALLALGFFANARPVADEMAWQRRPVTEVDRLAGEYRVARLKGDWPFVEVKRDVALPVPETPIEQIALDWYLGRLPWLKAMNSALVEYQQTQNYPEASRVAMNIATAFPFEANPRYVAGQMLIRQGRKHEALRYFHAAASLAPNNAEYLIALGQAFYVNGQPDNARATLDRLLSMDPNNERAQRMRSQLEQEPAIQAVDPG